MVQSICKDDFSGAMKALIDLIGSRLESVCLPRKFVRDAQGLVGCDVIWTLPSAANAAAPAATPRSCDQLPFAERVAGASDDGGERCRVRQLPIKDEAGAQAPGSDGWYYDDFSATLATDCADGQRQQLAFTTGARPPNGVRVDLQCLAERTRLPEQAREGVVPQQTTAQPVIGDACDHVERGGQQLSGNAACEVHLQAPSASFPDAVDRSMICHPQANVCIRPCSTGADCPAGWSVRRPAGDVRRHLERGAAERHRLLRERHLRHTAVTTAGEEHHVTLD